MAELGSAQARKMIDDAFFRAVIGSGRAILGEVKRLMVTSPRSGRTYRRLTAAGSQRMRTLRENAPQAASTTREYVNRVLNQPYSRLRRPAFRPPTRGEKRILRYRNVSIGEYILHRASAPGEPPAPDRGMAGGLISRLDIMVTQTVKGFDIGLGAGGDDVARYLEQGTSRMLPRPAWGRAVETVRRQKQDDQVVPAVRL